MSDRFLERIAGALAPRYEVTREIGRGGMALVLEAVDARHRRSVAIKVVMPELAASLGAERFLREIEVLASLQHRGIVPLFDSGLAEGVPYLVMPLIRGESLRKRLDRERQLPFSDALRIARELAESLEYAHRRDVIHRDVKPANILLEGGHAILADFGIARALAGPREGGLTQTGVSVGTPHYMSPEQASGEPVDRRSDVYALGCVLHEMLGGEPPFTGPTAEVVIRQHLSVKPRPVTDLRPSTPPHVALVILRALSKTPAERFQSAAEFEAALADPASGEVHPEAPTVSVAGPVARRRRRYGPLRVGAAALGLGAIAWTVWLGVDRIAHDDRGSAEAAVVRHPVLVADFEGPPTDPGMAAAARQLVMAALDESDRLESVSREGIQHALALAGRPDSTRLDGSLARELAFRGGIEATLEGRIDRMGSTFGIVLVARDAESGRVLSSVQGEARGENELIPTLGKLSRKIRRELGERSAVFTPSGPRWTAATPSFEAYRKYSAAFEMQQLRGDDRGSIVLLNEALLIDPDFAEAWALKMFAHGHLGERDSGALAMDAALKRPHRLTEEGRMFLEGLRDAERGDLELAEAKYRELIRRGYQLSSSLGNYGAILWRAGRYAEALDQYSRAVKVSSFGPQQWVLGAEVELLLMFGRVAEARAEAGRLQGGYADEAWLAIAVTAGEWDRADSLAHAYEQDALRARESKRIARLVRGCLAASRGELRRARDLLSDFPGRLVLLEAAARSAGVGVRPREQADAPARGALVRGIDAASRGDLVAARSALKSLSESATGSTLPADDDQTLLRACLAGAEGNWADAAALLVPLANAGERPGVPLSPPMVRWLAADAYERAGLRDSAAAHFERVLRADQRFWMGRLEARLLSPFVHHRLARLYALMGRTRPAEEQLEAAKALLKQGDPEVRQLLGATPAVRGLTPNSRAKRRA